MNAFFFIVDGCICLVISAEYLVVFALLDSWCPNPALPLNRTPVHRFCVLCTHASKYGDDDFDTAAIDPFRLFLIFNELVDAGEKGTLDQNLAHMLDQSHNITDPIESLMQSAMEIQRAYAQALLVDREALAVYQLSNDALMAAQELKQAFRTDVEAILAMGRVNKNCAAKPIATYRKAAYRDTVAKERPIVAAGPSGIV